MYRVVDASGDTLLAQNYTRGGTVTVSKTKVKVRLLPKLVVGDHVWYESGREFARQASLDDEDTIVWSRGKVSGMFYINGMWQYRVSASEDQSDLPNLMLAENLYLQKTWEAPPELDWETFCERRQSPSTTEDDELSVSVKRRMYLSEKVRENAFPEAGAEWPYFRNVFATLSRTRKANESKGWRNGPPKVIIEAAMGGKKKRVKLQLLAHRASFEWAVGMMIEMRRTNPEETLSPGGQYELYVPELNVPEPDQNNNNASEEASATVDETQKKKKKKKRKRKKKKKGGRLSAGDDAEEDLEDMSAFARKTFAETLEAVREGNRTTFSRVLAKVREEESNMLSGGGGEQRMFDRSNLDPRFIKDENNRLSFVLREGGNWRDAVWTDAGVTRDLFPTWNVNSAQGSEYDTEKYPMFPNPRAIWNDPNDSRSYLRRFGEAAMQRLIRQHYRLVGKIVEIREGGAIAKIEVRLRLSASKRVEYNTRSSRDPTTTEYAVRFDIRLSDYPSSVEEFRNASVAPILENDRDIDYLQALYPEGALHKFPAARDAR